MGEIMHLSTAFPLPKQAHISKSKLALGYNNNSNDYIIISLHMPL